MNYSPPSPMKTLDIAPVSSGASRPPPPRRRSETRVARQNSVILRHDDGSCDSSLSDEVDWGTEAMDPRPPGRRWAARAAEVSGPVHSSSVSDVVGSEGMPHHWRGVESLFAASANAKDRDPVQDESPSRESEQPYWALQKLRSLDESPPPGYDRDSDESSNSGSSSLWDKTGSNHSANRSTRTERSPLKLCARRWAKATVGCAALAALGLSVTAIHLFSDDPQAFKMVHRNIPEGEGNGKDAVPIPWLPREDQDKDPDEETASPQEQNRRSKGDRMQDHEEQVRLQVAECKRRNYEAVACQSMLQDARHYDTPYYNVSEDDGRTAPQDGQYRRLLRGVDLDRGGDEESYNFQYRRYLQGIDDEYRGDEGSSRGLRMVQALFDGLEREFEQQQAGVQRLS